MHKPDQNLGQNSRKSPMTINYILEQAWFKATHQKTSPLWWGTEETSQRATTVYNVIWSSPTSLPDISNQGCVSPQVRLALSAG